MDAPTRSALFDLGVGELRARSLARPPGTRLDPEMAFVEGSDLNLQTASASAMADEVIRQMVLRAAALLLDSAQADDLDRLVADRFSPTIVRKQASPSVGPLSLSRSAGTLPAVTLPVGTQVKTASGIAVSTMLAVSLPLGSNGPVTVPAQATTAGAQGNVAIGTLNTFVVRPSDSNVVVTNPQPFAGGDNRESDPSLRARARAFYLTARRGTILAIEQGALTVAGVRQAVAVEETDLSGDPTGRVSLFIADVLGQANSALVTSVTSAESEYRAAGIVLDIASAVPVYEPITLRLRFAAGLDTQALSARVANAVVAAVNALAPNAKLEVSLITQAARTVPGVIVLADAVVAPVGDVVPALGNVIRTSQTLVTFVS